MKLAPWALAFAIVWSGEAWGRILWQQGELSLELSGSFREVADVTHGTSEDEFSRAIVASLPQPTCVIASLFADCPAFRVVGDQGAWRSLSRLRTQWDLRLTRAWSATVVYDQQVMLGTLRTLEGRLTRNVSTSSWLPLEDTIVSFDFGGSADEGSWRHLLYRAHLSYEGEHVEAIIGRQRIPWGVGRLWSPVDRFNFIPPLAIEPDQSPGVDAVDAKWLFSGFTFLEAVLAPQDAWEDSSYALRLHGVLWDTDYSLFAGNFRDAPAGGVDLARNLGDNAVRLEAVYADPTRSVWPIGASHPTELPAFWQVVVSADRNIDVGSGIYVLVEYLYNGNALGFGRGLAGPFLSLFEATDAPPAELPPELADVVDGPFVTTTSADRLGGSQVVTTSRHQTGIELAYDVFPALHSELFTLYDWEGTSVAVVPALRYDPYPFLELTLGTQLFAGPKRSEYGSGENLGFLIADLFF